MPRRKQVIVNFEIAAAKAIAAGITPTYLSGRLTDTTEGLIEQDTARELTPAELRKVTDGRA